MKARTRARIPAEVYHCRQTSTSSHRACARARWPSTRTGCARSALPRTGDLIGVRTGGEVVRFRDVNADGSFEGDDEVVTIANTGGNGNNAHLDEQGGYLYAGSPDGVVRWPYSTEADSLGTPEPVVVNQPSSGTHTYHTVHVYDGWVYVHSGSEDNLVAPMLPDYDTNRSVLKRLTCRSSGRHFTGPGVSWWPRVCATWSASRGSPGNLSGVVNGIDELAYAGQDVHVDNPGKPLIQIEAGQAFGYPYCFTAQNISTGDGPVAPGTQLAVEMDGFENPHDDAWCQASSEPPLSFLPAHSAPLDIGFYVEPDGATPRGLPDAWLGGAFVSQHGSWNTDPSVGHKVVHVPFGAGEPSMPATDQQPPVFPFTVVLGGGSSTGHVDGSWGWSSGDRGEDPVRPVGVAVSPVDGALYISSDGEGVLYRVGLVPGTP